MSSTSYTVTSSSFRARYSRIVNDIVKRDSIIKLDKAMEEFLSCEDPILLSNIHKSLHSEIDFLSIKLKALETANSKWDEFIRKLKDNKRKAELETREAYFEEKVSDESDLTKSFDSISSIISFLIAEAQSCVAIYQKKLREMDPSVQHPSILTSTDVTQASSSRTDQSVDLVSSVPGSSPETTSAETENLAIANHVSGSSSLDIIHPSVSFNRQNSHPSGPLNQIRDTVVNSNVSSRLPPLQLPRFKGDIISWMPFWERFEECIHSRADIPDSDKLAYLTSLVDNAPRELINAYPSIGSSYAPVIELLKKTYSHSFTSGFSLSSLLIDISSKSHSAQDQVITVSKVKSILNQMSKSENVDGSCVLTNIVLTKFSPEVIKRVTDTLDINSCSLSSMLDFIENHLTKNIAANMIISRTDSSHNHPHSSSRSQSSVPREFHSNVKKSDQNEKKGKSASRSACVLCDKPHINPGSCRTLPTPEMRQARVKERKLCNACLSPSHSHCQARCSGCQGNHHAAVCRVVPIITAHTVSSSLVPSRVRLMTATVCLENPVTKKKARFKALLDCGSTVSLVSQEVVQKIGVITTDTVTTSLSGVTGASAIRQYPVANLSIKSSKWSLPFNALVLNGPIVSSIDCESLSLEDTQVIQEKYGGQYKNCADHDFVPSILLGIQEFTKIIKGEATVLPSGYSLFHSHIGPIVAGGHSMKETQINHLSHQPSPDSSQVTPESDDQRTLSQRLESFLGIEELNIEVPTEKNHRIELDKAVEKHFQDTVKYENNEYVVKYYVKEEVKNLPSNYGLAASRLRSLYNSLSKKKSHLSYYDRVIQDQISSGQVEYVSNTNPGDVIHYISHQAVERPDKPSTPLRIVYDASAKMKGCPSLNDVIAAGPNLTSEITSILIRARAKPVIIVSDVEKAFHQVRLDESQRDMFRFLWLRDISIPPDKSNIVELRFTVTPFGVNMSPYLLNRVIRNHLDKLSSTTTESILCNLYVDNVIIGTDSCDQKWYRESKDLFSSMHMNLRDYVSNVSSFNEEVPEKDRGDAEKQKLLGIAWYPRTDQLLLRMPSDLPRKATKRSVLSYSASLFDPLGILSPVSFQLKCFMQSLWKKEYEWDSELDEDDTKKWHSLHSELAGKELIIDRYTPFSLDTIHLVVFADASVKGRGCVVYLHEENVGGHIVLSRSFINNAKCKLTIPKLELEAVMAAFVMLQYVIESLSKQFNSKSFVIHPFSDSTTVLHWLNSESDYKLGPFISGRVNRMKKICSSFEEKGMLVHPVKYVETSQNPADHLTRGLSVTELLSSNWIRGPEWLKEPVKKWPSKDCAFETVCATVSIPSSEPSIVPFNRFSSLSRLVNVVAYIRRFITNIRAKLSKTEKQEGYALTVSERQSAFITILSEYQSEVKLKDHPLASEKILYRDDDGIWRRMTRMENSELTVDAKNPIQLCKSNHPFITLIISDLHVRLKHQGINHTLSEFRRIYSLANSRNRIKRVLQECVPCRKTNNRPFSYPSLPSLPESRVVKNLPFTHSGIDFIGPFNGQKNVKYYCLIITCLTTRLLHLELTASMDTVSVINALKRFVARRGCPRTILSDKAPTFSASSVCIDHFVSDDNSLFNSFLSENVIQWRYTTSHAPWKGAVYERMIKEVKNSLQRNIGRRQLSFDDLSTALIEIEGILNCRPLTYLFSHSLPHFENQTIRPIDFLLPMAHLGFPTIANSDSSDRDYGTSKEMRTADVAHRLSFSHELVESFWIKWRDEYLVSLRDRPNTSPLQNGSHSVATPKVGEVVLIMDESGITPRGNWPMGKIVSIEGTTVKLRNGVRRIIERPLNYLIPLEINSVDPEIIINHSTSSNEHNSHAMITRAKRRKQ